MGANDFLLDPTLRSQQAPQTFFGVANPAQRDLDAQRQAELAALPPQYAPDSPQAQLDAANAASMQAAGPAAAVEGPRVAPLSAVQMAESMLNQNASGQVVNADDANLYSLQNTFHLPGVGVVSAETANRLARGGTRVNPAAMAQYQAVSGEAGRAREEADDARRAIGTSAMAVGASGQIAAEQSAEHLQGYMDRAAQIEHQAARSQVEYNKEYQKFQAQMDADKRAYDDAVRGPTGFLGLADFGRGIGMAVAAGLGAKAAVMSGTRNFAMDLIEKQLDRDMTMRRENINAAAYKMTKTQELFQTYRQKYGDDALARQATLASAKDAMATNIAKAVEQHRGTELYEKGVQFAKSLELEAAQNRANALDLAGQAIYKQVYTKVPGLKLKTAAEAMVEQANLRKTINAANPQAKPEGALSEGGEGRVLKVAGQMAKLGTTYNALDQATATLNASPYAARLKPTDAGTQFGVLLEGGTNAYTSFWSGAGVSEKEAIRRGEQIQGSSFNTNDQKRIHFEENKKEVVNLFKQQIGGLNDAERNELFRRLRREGVPEKLLQEVEDRSEAEQTKADSMFGVKY